MLQTLNCTANYNASVSPMPASLLRIIESIFCERERKDNFDLQFKQSPLLAVLSFFSLLLRLMSVTHSSYSKNVTSKNINWESKFPFVWIPFRYIHIQSLCISVSVSFLSKCRCRQTLFTRNGFALFYKCRKRYGCREREKPSRRGSIIWYLFKYTSWMAVNGTVLFKKPRNNTQ